MLRKIILATLTLTFGLCAVASAQDAKLIEKGKEVYAAAKPACSMCHSIEGKGNAKGPLDGVGSKLKPEEIREWLTNPQEMAKKHNATRKPMKQPYTKMAKEDMDALVAYLHSLKKK